MDEFVMFLTELEHEGVVRKVTFCTLDSEPPVLGETFCGIAGTVVSVERIERDLYFLGGVELSHIPPTCERGETAALVH